MEACELTGSSELVVVEYDAQSSQTLCWHSQQVRETSSGPKDFRHTLQSSPLLVLPAASDFLQHQSALSAERTFSIEAPSEPAWTNRGQRRRAPVA